MIKLFEEYNDTNQYYREIFSNEINSRLVDDQVNMEPNMINKILNLNKELSLDKGQLNVINNRNDVTYLHRNFNNDIYWIVELKDEWFMVSIDGKCYLCDQYDGLEMFLRNYKKDIKLFEEYNDIHSICKKYDIKNYTINPDGSIDVDDNVNLHSRKLIKLPLKFRNVTGHFDCCNNQLTSLEGSPKEIGGNFICSSNQLISLEGCPSYVGGNFDCYHNNKLTSLKGSPKEIGGTFYCHQNKLTSLEGSPKEVGDDFICYSNQLTSLKGAPIKVGGHFYCDSHLLPYLISQNIKYIKDIIKYQDEYGIWNRDGSLNEYRFNEMMIDIRDI